ncbi:MAG: hypothetical protein PHF37_09860, partial [Phycisphaerae bacterium]|nr:hypothetical protein [Phycisphaerae bacterium]
MIDQTVIDKFKQNPVAYAYAYLIPPTVKLYTEQEQIIESTYFEPETYVKSYHSAGKTYTASIA